MIRPQNLASEKSVLLFGPIWALESTRTCSTLANGFRMILKPFYDRLSINIIKGVVLCRLIVFRYWANTPRVFGFKSLVKQEKHTHFFFACVLVWLQCATVSAHVKKLWPYVYAQKVISCRWKMLLNVDICSRISKVK